MVASARPRWPLSTKRPASVLSPASSSNATATGFRMAAAASTPRRSAATSRRNGRAINHDKKAFDRPVDVGFIEGGCSNEYNVRELKKFRKHCRILVSVGACAINGGVPAMRNAVGLRECLETAYLGGLSPDGAGIIPNDEDIPLLLDRVYPSHEVVKIDYFLPGCPPSGEAIWEGLKALLTGQVPVLPYLLCKYE